MEDFHMNLNLSGSEMDLLTIDQADLDVSLLLRPPSLEVMGPNLLLDDTIHVDLETFLSADPVQHPNTSSSMEGFWAPTPPAQGMYASSQLPSRASSSDTSDVVAPLEVSSRRGRKRKNFGEGEVAKAAKAKKEQERRKEEKIRVERLKKEVPELRKQVEMLRNLISELEYMNSVSMTDFIEMIQALN